MKRKKSAAPAAVSAGQEFPTVSSKAGAAMDMVWVCLFSLLLFLSMTVQTGRMSMILLVLALVLSVGRRPLGHLRQRFCVPVIGIFAFAVMQGLAAIYSPFDTYAIKEYYKFLAAFALAVILLVRFEKKHVRGLLWGLTIVCALISLISIDAAASGILFLPFNSFVEMLGASFADVEQNVWNSRVAGIYNDANITGSIFALGSLLSLYLVNSEKVLWKRAEASVLLGICAMGFFLSLSRGAIFCFVLALLVWLLAVEKGKRLSLFFLMFFSALVVVALSIPAISGISAGSALPELLTVVSGLQIFALDWAVGSRLAQRLEGHGKTIAVVVAVLAVLCGGYAIAALNVTGPYTFDQSGYLIRTLELEPGEYSLSGDWEGEIEAVVIVQDQMDLIHSSATTLYEGPLADTAFTAPGEGRVSIQLWGEPEKTVRALTLSNGSEIPLDYPLMPAFVANRLQDSLFSSSSTFMRLQYDKDAWKIFKRSPLLGHGLGSTEGLYTAVQPFFYASRYVHNHILQVMCDMGLLGLAGFLALLLGSAWLLLRNLRSETGGLAAMLLACWVMINTHSLMEINFSIRAYQCIAFALLLFPVVLYGKPLTEKAEKWGGLVLIICVWAYLAVFGGLVESHRLVEKKADSFSSGSAREFMTTLESFISKDVFVREDMQLTYVANAAVMNDSIYNGTMRKYVTALRNSGTYTACSGLARYYYLQKGQFEELFVCSREGIAQEASEKDAWNLEIEFYRNEVLPAVGAEQMDVFTDGVLALRDYLAEYSEGRLEEIELTEENQAFLETVSSAKEAGMSGKDLYILLTEILGYGTADTAG